MTTSFSQKITELYLEPNLIGHCLLKPSIQAYWTGLPSLIAPITHTQLSKIACAVIYKIALACLIILTALISVICVPLGLIVKSIHQAYLPKPELRPDEPIRQTSQQQIRRSILRPNNLLSNAPMLPEEANIPSSGNNCLFASVGYSLQQLPGGLNDANLNNRVENWSSTRERINTVNWIRNWLREGDAKQAILQYLIPALLEYYDNQIQQYRGKLQQVDFEELTRRYDLMINVIEKANEAGDEEVTIDNIIDDIIDDIRLWTEDYLIDMQYNYGMAGYIELYALSQQFNVEIQVFQKRIEGGQAQLNPDMYGNPRAFIINPKADAIICLIHVNRNHYHAYNRFTQT